MEIVNIAAIVVFVAIPLLVLMVTMLLGFKRNIFQSGTKLLMTILSIVISAVIVKYGVPGALSNSLGLFNEMISADIINYLQTSNLGQDIIRMASTFIMPLVFFVVFALVAIVFALLYLIPGRLLSNKAFARREAKMLSKTNVKGPTGSDGTEISSVETEFVQGAAETSDPQKGSGKWAKAGLRASSIICSVFSGFLVLACLATPLNAYSELIQTTFDDLDVVIEETDTSAKEVVNILASVNNHPVNQCYKPFNGILSRYFDRFTTHDGIKVVASDTVVSAAKIIDSLSKLSSGSMDADLFYTLSDKISETPFICNVLSNLVSDMCSAWGKGETFFGVTPPEFGSESMSSLVFNTLADCDDITSAMRVVADTLVLQQSMQSSTEGSLAMIQQVFNGMTAESADLIKRFMSEDILSDISGMPDDMAENVTTFIDGVLNGIVEIKEDSGLSDAEKSEILNQEAEALAVVLELTQTPENMNADTLVSAIVDSKVLTGTIQSLTKNGTVTDPYYIAEVLPSQFVSEVATKLVDEGISENSDLYNSVMALISK